MTPQSSMDDDVEPRVRALEREFAARVFLMDECAALRERVSSLERQIAPLVLLSPQLTSLAAQLGELKTELASFKGRALGVLATITFVAPLVASTLTALLMKVLKP